MTRTDCIDTMSAPVAPVPSLTWAAWVRAGAWLVRREVVRLRDTMAIWRERRRGRRFLMTLDERTLQDIGLSRCNALAEFDRPFWRS